MQELDLQMETLENIEAPEISTGEIIGRVMIAMGTGILVGLAAGLIT